MQELYLIAPAQAGRALTKLVQREDLTQGSSEWTADKAGQEAKQLVFFRKSAKSLLDKEVEQGAEVQWSFLLL